MESNSLKFTSGDWQACIGKKGSYIFATHKGGKGVFTVAKIPFRGDNHDADAALFGASKQLYLAALAARAELKAAGRRGSKAMRLLDEAIARSEEVPHV